MKKSHLFLGLILVAGALSIVVPAVISGGGPSINWGLISTIFVVLAVIALFFEFEAAAVSSKDVALVAMLGTLSAITRIPFAAVPGLQPSSFFIICTGYVFGPVAGFMVGALTALVSNFFLGQGPWTPYQMLAWGLLGILASLLRRFHLGRVPLLVFGVFAGYLYGWIVNTWYWASFIYPLTFRTFLVYQFSSIWMDTFHAAGNALFLGLLGTRVITILDRFRKRFNWRASPRAPATGIE